MHVFVPICAHSHTVVHRKMHSCKAHTCRQVFLSGVSSCQALLIHARFKDSLRHCAHASTHSTFTAHRCTPDLPFLLFGCRKEWMLHCYLPLSVSKERCCHPIAFVWSFAETHLSEGKELRVDVHTEENKKVEEEKKQRSSVCVCAHTAC